MTLKIKAKAFIGCLMASLLFSTPLLATGVKLSLAKVSEVNKERLKAYVNKVLNSNADNSILSSCIYLLMYKEIFYGSLVRNCTEDFCSYDKDKVDAVIDENIGSAIKRVYDEQVLTGATEGDIYAWVENNLCTEGCDSLDLLKDSVKNITVITVESNRICIMDMGDKNKIIIIFDSAGSVLGVKYNKVNAYHKYELEYIFTFSDMIMKVSESTFCENLLDSTEDRSVPGGMVTNFEAMVTLDNDGNVLKKAGKIYVYNKFLSCLDYKFELKDDTLSSAANGNYVSIDELFTATEPTVELSTATGPTVKLSTATDPTVELSTVTDPTVKLSTVTEPTVELSTAKVLTITVSGDGKVQNLSSHLIDAWASNGDSVSIAELLGDGDNVSIDEFLSNLDNVSIAEPLGDGDNVSIDEFLSNGDNVSIDEFLSNWYSVSIDELSDGVIVENSILSNRTRTCGDVVGSMRVGSRIIENSIIRTCGAALASMKDSKAQVGVVDI
ncbi:MAG: hypothetical protein QS721_09725 [Candidatus Endonucleobacter sp. (ex Gigantidas childressi)]|nr:hypothetical protein [Candidatus Endonucleobacter sp. (ex Gigantidas childressi)]